MMTEMPTSLSCDALVVMGVSASGKSTVGAVLARRLGWAELDADDFHPPANIDKMSTGTPLTDADRAPWLALLRAELDRRVTTAEPAVLACSALKRAYRDVLRAGTGVVGFVYMRASREVLVERLAGRADHFFPGDLIDSQLATLEEPDDEENALTVDATDDAESITDRILAHWRH